MLLIPGAPPQSTTAVSLFILASLSSAKGSSGKKAMSTAFLPSSSTARRVLNPMNPGTALMTRSASRMAFLTLRVSARSSWTVLILGNFLSLSSALEETSTAVTLASLSADMSLAIGPPTKPAPNIVIFIASLLFYRIGDRGLKRRDEEGRLQAGKMVDEEDSLTAVDDGGGWP